MSYENLFLYFWAFTSILAKLKIPNDRQTARERKEVVLKDMRTPPKKLDSAKRGLG